MAYVHVSRAKERELLVWHKEYSKPAYTYRTLTKMCSDKSIGSKLKRNGEMYTASWKRPDGKKVWAMWTSKSEKIIELGIKGVLNFVDRI